MRSQEEAEVSTAALVGVPSFLIKTYDIVNVSFPRIYRLGAISRPYNLLERHRRLFHCETAERVR